MKNGLRAMLIISLLLVSVMSTGCAKTFYFSFKDEEALFNESYAFLVEEGSPYFLSDKGLVLDASRVLTPLYFRGDATIKIGFHADCSEFELAYFGVRLWNGSPENAHLFELYLGNPVNQIYKLGELTASYEMRAGDGPAIPGYHGHGDYVLKIVKKGGAYSAYIGGSLLGEYVAEDFLADWLYISFKGELFSLTSPDSFYVKYIKVSYDEGVILP